MHDRLRRFIRSRTACDADADDVVQEVFVRVHKNLGSVRDASRIEPWLFQVARNALIDFQRKKVTLATSFDREIAFNCSQEFNEVIAEWLRNVITLLPEDQQRAVEMYEFGGKSQVEIADIEGVTVSAVKSRIQRARLRIADLMRSCCELQFDGRGNLLSCEPQPNRSCTTNCGCESD